MEKTKSRRKIDRALFTRHSVNLNKFLEEKKYEEARAAFASLEQYFENINAQNEEVMEWMLDNGATEEELEQEALSADEYRSKYELLKVRCLKIDTLERQSTSSEYSANVAQVNRKIKLPTIEFRKFGGELRDWLPFWNQFQRIHENVEIAPVDKFYYLMQATLPNSRARSVVDSFPATDDNYMLVIEALQERFGREDLLIEVYIRDLLSLTLPTSKSCRSLTEMYDKLECHLRALESLGVTTGKCAAILCPLLESCMTEDFLRVWQRSPLYSDIGNAEQRLTKFMSFMKAEVQNEERIHVAMSGFKQSADRAKKVQKDSSPKSCSRENIPTAMGLLSLQENKRSACIFCSDVHHSSTDCYKARDMPLSEKLDIIKDKKYCFICIKPNHVAKRCTFKQKCLICDKRHVILLCPDLKRSKNLVTSTDSRGSEVVTVQKDEALANLTCDNSVLLPTLLVKVRGNGSERTVKAVLDTGSQRSYILKGTAREMNYSPVGRETIVHSLFGGQKTGSCEHNKYRIHLASLTNHYLCNFEVLDQDNICGNVPHIQDRALLSELVDDNNLQEVLCSPGTVEILIGADIAARLFTGNVRSVSCGLIAMETRLGWTIFGKYPSKQPRDTTAMIVTSMLINDSSLPSEQAISKAKDDSSSGRISTSVNVDNEDVENDISDVQTQILPSEWAISKVKDDSSVQKTNTSVNIDNGDGDNDILESDHVGKAKKEGIGVCDAPTQCLDAVLAWIRREDPWATFVGNRVNEIRKLTQVEQWHHVPGVCNPADLPSRGCSAKSLLQSTWWEGPEWLYQQRSGWPSAEVKFEEDVISQERKNTVVSSMLCAEADSLPSDWYYRYFSKSEKNIRMIAWMCRFGNNCRVVGSEHFVKKTGPLSTEEVASAEIRVLKLVQKDAFPSNTDPRIYSLQPFEDHDGLLRLRTKISNRPDSHDFRYPVLLPKNHPFVSQLIMDVHVRRCHVGVQGLLSVMRERFWVIGGRRTLRSVLAKCVICKRQEAKPLVVSTPPLPVERVREAAAFEVSDVDMAGPLYLKNCEKAWICLFTCGVTRAVHLELLLSLSTDAFLQAFSRFVARRGRPVVIFSDNGTKFSGTETAFSRIDWSKVHDYCSVERIKWKFNPPTAAWWGGWWERLIGLVKRILRRTLGRTSLTYSEMETVLCDCESVVNSRPLTYTADNSNELGAITPAMFLQDIREASVPEIDIIESSSLSKRLKYRLTLKENLRKRFRSEYLGQLRQQMNAKQQRNVQVDDVVLIGNDNSKRLDWPLGKIVELLPGKDGVTRLVRLKTASGEILRPVQRLYLLLEAKDNEPKSEIESSVSDSERMAEETVKEDSDVSWDSVGDAGKVNKTQSGRMVKMPKRYLD